MDKNSVNLIIIVGELDRDAVVKQTAGAPICNFIVVTSERWTDTKGQPHERVDRHHVEWWGSVAEKITPRLKRGTNVYIEGKIQTRNWTDPQGLKRFTTVVHAKRVDIVQPGTAVLEQPDPDSATRPAASDQSLDPDDTVF